VDVKNSTETPVSTRDRLIGAMLYVLPRKGYHGVGLAELLAHAQAPKGVLYHHFPGGKSALAVAAIEVVVVQITSSLDALMALYTDPVDAFSAWMGSAQKKLTGSQYERGCPLATIALETTPDDVDIRRALAQAFATIRDHLAHTLVSAGQGVDPARDLAALMVAAYEGALLQARVAENTDSMQQTSKALFPLLRLSLQAARSTSPTKDTP
jgi:TetR/AcrR family transcriptional repressor of lmrAB and yxaGH operons